MLSAIDCPQRRPSLHTTGSSGRSWVSLPRSAQGRRATDLPISALSPTVTEQFPDRLQFPLSFLERIPNLAEQLMPCLFTSRLSSFAFFGDVLSAWYLENTTFEVDPIGRPKLEHTAVLG